MRRVIQSFIIYFMLLTGVLSSAVGFYFLNRDEIELYSDVIKGFKEYKIETYTGERFFSKKLLFFKKDGKVMLKLDDRTFPVYQIRSVNGIDINAAVVKQISRNATNGMWLTACGGFLIIISIALKDYF
ncbi:hypothetical protein GWK41_09055 [Persephonella atlantica]|uniref:DUF3592 domain-containing protein n=1 Tax=Persephonella atlantica TaxID=2699429 RepID=A0ABS1GK62_9AQUI|nr:hypothetical protein [Persephonella atlantica]MBK3333216.1 hypothetical protein [Persephonella atlantica]